MSKNMVDLADEHPRSQYDSRDEIKPSADLVCVPSRVIDAVKELLRLKDIKERWELNSFYSLPFTRASLSEINEYEAKKEPAWRELKKAMLAAAEGKDKP